MKNKKAQGLSTNTIILIILGLVVLVVLIIGFTMGFKDLKERFFPENNIQAIADQCNLACSLGQEYEYCNKLKELKSDSETLKEVSCYILNKKRSGYKVPDCPTINCDIYDHKDLAKAYCEGEWNSANGDSTKETKVKIMDVFYIEELPEDLKLIESNCAKLLELSEEVPEENVP